MEIKSPTFASDRPIPLTYTCEDRDVSPPLDFGDVPDDARELVLIVDDPDAPRGTFTHWMVWNLDPGRKGIQEGTSGNLGAREGLNDFGEPGWRGPCPPPGHGPHTYRFTLYAVDEPVALSEDASRAELDEALRGHVLEEAGLRVTFER